MCKFKGSTKPEGEVKARLRRLFSSRGAAVGSWECARASVCVHALGFQQ